MSGSTDLSKLLSNLSGFIKKFWAYGVAFILLSIDALSFLHEIPITYEYKISLLIGGILALLSGILYQLTTIEMNLREDIVRNSQAHAAQTYVEKRKNSIKNVRIIQYSAKTTYPIIDTLLKSPGCESIDLLLVNPSSLTDKQELEYQTNRVVDTLKSLYLDKKLLNKLSIRMYNVPGSIRGFNFDNKYVIIGWYHYDSIDDRIKIHGEHNPVIAIDTKSDNGEVLCSFFNTIYAELVKNSTNLKDLLQKDDNFLKGLDGSYRTTFIENLRPDAPGTQKAKKAVAPLIEENA